MGLCLLPIWASAQDGDKQGIAFFENKIRPVLAGQCYSCHAASAKKVKGGLYLDSKEGMLRGGDSGPALVPGKANESLLIKALKHDGDTKMPPKMARLDEQIIADFVWWIDMGAPDPRTSSVAIAKKGIDIEKGRSFWAFQPLAVHAPPQVKDTAWGRTPIDRFILAKLEEKKLAPNAPLARERLIRRVYFDLLGLPPTPEQVNAFVLDKAPDAYDKLVDRLLQSEHMGERWGRHWLDLVRFAESGGYEFDKDRPSAYHYRDFVIKALNQDMPFDQFVRWQIAGDHLAPGNLLAASATGFLVAGPYPGQTTAKTLQLIRYNHLDDMISTLGSSMLGLSVGCARCHAHKYDPIPQEDYYRLIASLSRTDSTVVKIDTDADGFARAKAEFDRAHAPLVKARADFEAQELLKHLRAWREAKKETSPAAWLILDLVDAQGKTPLVKQADGSVLARGKAEKNDAIKLVAHTMQRGIKALRLEALADKSLPKSGPGQGPGGSFVLSQMVLTAAPLHSGNKAKPLQVKMRPGKASAEAEDFTLAGVLDNDPATGWSVGKQIGKNHAASFELEGDIGFEGGTIFTLTLKSQNQNFAIGRPRLAISTMPILAKLDGRAEQQHAAELQALPAGKDEFTQEQRASIGRWLRKFDARVDAVYQSVEQHARKAPRTTVESVFAASSNKGGDVYFLIRGEVEKKRELARAGFIQVLMNHADRDEHWLGKSAPTKKKADPQATRAALANWITDADHGAGHLLARVIVNRLWQHHLGRGIVGTPNDFGAQGDPPTHPELLDYLAAELIKGGWKLKPIHKLIMTSAVYMQSGEIHPGYMQADPQNRLWWRRPPQRLEAEAIRDAVLAVAGTLDAKMYGPGTLDGNSARRSVYLTVKRSKMIPLMQIFDVPEAMQSIGERSVTTVPTQSLAFMNSPLIRQSAQKFAARIRSDSLSGAVEQAYMIALSRRPTDPESQRMQAFIERQIASYGAVARAREFALTDCCQVLLCLNEFIYVD